MSRMGSLEQMLDDYKSGIVDCTENNECSNCGGCCSNLIPVSAKEVETIKRYIEENHIKERECMYPTTEPILDLSCPFRDETNKVCTIYPVRPAICREFRCDKPYEESMKNKEKHFIRCGGCADMRVLFFGKESLISKMFGGGGK